MSRESSLSQLLKEEARSIWERILKHPFVIELYRGDLPLDKFKYYVKQDYNYLIGMMKAYSLLAAKSEYEVAKKALEIAHADATIEMDNYVRLLSKLGMTLDEVLSEEPSPTNEAYMNFLIRVCALGSPLECLVATLPCFWTYAEIAETYKSYLDSNPVEIYVEWGRTYLSKEYKELLRELIDIVDSLWKRRGGDYDTLRKLFIMASVYEWMFWDAAYRMERWPLKP